MQLAIQLFVKIKIGIVYDSEKVKHRFCNEIIMKKELKVLAVSDTHEYTQILDKIAAKEEGDIFIHAGDFTDYGQEKYFHSFFDLLPKLRFKYKVVISGNH